MRITRRDVVVATISIFVAVAGMAFAQAAAVKPLLHSCVFNWADLKAVPTKQGERRAVFDAPTPTLANLECHITTLNKGNAAHPPHRHADEELIIVKEGVVEALVAGEWVKLGPGSVIFQAANIDHAIRNAGEQPATYHVIKWNSPGMLKAKAEAAAATKAAVQK